MEKYNIPYQIVSRKTELNFKNLNRDIVKEHKIIIQCTPVGTFPNADDCLSFPFEGITAEHFVIDLIYNPPQTTFLKNAYKNCAKILNGQLMLEKQAEKSWEIWSLI